MKLPRRFVTKLSLATVLAASAGLGWAIPATMAGPIALPPAGIEFQAIEGVGDVTFDLTPNPKLISHVEFNPIGTGGQVDHISVANAVAAYYLLVHGPRAADLQVSTTLSYVFTDLITGNSGNNNILNTFIDADAEALFNGHRFLQLGIQTRDLPTAQVVDEESNAFIMKGVAPNVSQVVQLITEAEVADSQVNPKAEGFVIADPVITFAPGFDSTGFSLEFSPGVGNDPDPGPGSGTPEPSTLVLSSIVFGVWGLVWAYRQRQRTRAAA
jgi:hypothetical protein